MNTSAFDCPEPESPLAVVPPFAPSRFGRLLVAMLLALAALLTAVVADAAPAFRLRPGPAPIPVDWEVSVVPKQKGHVWYVKSVFWTRDGSQWYRANSRREAWKPVADNRVPRPLKALSNSDWSDAEKALAKADNRRAPKPELKPAAGTRKIVFHVDEEDDDTLRQMRERNVKVFNQLDAQTKRKQVNAAAREPLAPRKHVATF